MTPSARLQAVIDILDELARTRQPADRVLRAWGRAHRFAGSKDRAAIAEHLYRIERHRASFGWRMRSDTPRALAMASVLEEAETLFSGAAYGPAALTEAERAVLAAAPGEAPAHVRGEYPQFLEAELARAFGPGLMDEMQAAQERAPVDLRVNTLKASRDEVVRALADASVTPYSPWGIRIPAGVTGLERHPLFLAGAFEFQDEAAQLAVLRARAEPGQRVLDLAAGAGGKALALAAQMEDTGKIVAHDISAARLAQIAPRAQRAGVTIIRTQTEPPRGRFDLVFLDAPCSGSGTWRRAPENKWRLTPERLAELNGLQDRLLDMAAAHGDRIVYATCSILPCENEDRVAAFLRSHPEFAAEGAFFRATPLSTGTDGFFAAVLARPGAVG